MDTNKEVNKVMSELKSAGSSKVSLKSNLYGALIMMRTTLLKSKEAQTQLVQAGCIPHLLNLLTPPTTAGTWLKTVDIVISILANLCLEEEAREEVISNQGLSTIVEATKCTEKESIHNRGVRAVANLIQHSSKSDEICNEVVDLEFHIFVAKRLMETKEKDCKQTYLRAVRLFGQRKKQLVRLVADTRSVQAVASLLKEGNEKLMQKSLRILHEFSALRCCANFVEQILAANILEELVQAVESSDDEISSLSLSVILKLCEYENIRPPLGAAGLISTLMRLMDCERSHVNHISILNALCLCCFEAVNRHRLYQERTLELFMSILSPERLNDEAGKFSVLRDRIISCLVCFLYNDECFDKLLELKLVTAVIGHLNKECNLQMSDGDWSKEVEMILNESKIGVKETTADEDENNALFHNEHNENEQSKDNVDEPLSLSKNGNITKEDGLNDVKGNDFSSDHLDQEIMDISMDDTNIIPPSGTQDSRHTFSIDSPTYQMEQHSWRLEDHTSGVTCKNYSEDVHQDNINPRPVTEGSGKFSPYSPLSVGSSYYSPAYPSPAHSLGSSPRHSNFQTGSFILGSQSPRSSPAWSPSHSLHSEDTWSNSDPAGRSPSNSIHSPNYQQGQFSPLINPYPASPPSVYLIEERNVAENPLFISQVSNTSNQTVDSQADMFSDYPKSMFSELSQQSVGRFSSFSEVLKGENEKPIYSASEDEDEESENPIHIQSSCDVRVEKSTKEVVDGHVQNDKEAAIGDTSSLETETANVKRTRDIKNEKRPKIEASTSSIKSMELEIEGENVTFSQSLLPGTNAPFVALNSQSSLSESSPKDENSLEKQEQDKYEGNIDSEQLPEKVIRLDSDILYSSQALSGKGSVKSGKKRFLKQCSFPGKSSLSYTGDKPSSPHPLGSSSPFRVQFDLPFSSPSMSPFSRYSNSPYASPNPYLSRPAQNFSSAGEGFSEESSKNDKKSSGKLSHSSDKTSTLLQCQPSCSTASLEDSNVLTEHENDQPSTSKSDKDKGSERLNRIKRKTEENILVLLSRISVKTDPSQHLPKYAVLSTLTKYIGVMPMPIQRCIRTLFRVFHNPHCFESVLLEQAPALIVKNLIMDQDGKFPSVLFKDQQDDGHMGPHISRKINFDDLFSCSQSSETPSDFELQIQFEFGGDAYSNMIHQRSFRSDVFQPNFLFRGKSMSRGMSIDGSYLHSSMTPEDLTRVRIRCGINLMKAITSLALSRYGDGEIQRIWSRGTESEKLMCAISLLHMPIGCGPLQRRQIILKHDALHQVIPLLFCKEAPLVREGIVTALSLLAHLFRIQKITPKMEKLINTCPEPNPSSCGNTELQMGAEQNVNTSLSTKEETQNVMDNACDDITCNFEHNSDKFNLNLIVADDKSGEKKVFRACKEILMKKSEVFCAMLGGGYAEAGKVDIEFSDLNLSGFEYVLHFLHGCKSGCAVIDLLSFKDSDFVSDCDRDCCLDTEESDCLSCGEPEVQNEVKIDFTSSTPREHDSNACALTNTNPPISSTMSGEKDSNINAHNLTTPTTSRENCSDVNVSETTKQIDFILDRCIDIITVADRFLVHDLIQYLTSVLSHTCLYTRTVTDIIYLASTYKLNGLATDCVVEVLLSHTSRKDITELFQILGLELDSDTKKMLIDILSNLFTSKAL